MVQAYQTCTRSGALLGLYHCPHHAGCKSCNVPWSAPPMVHRRDTSVSHPVGCPYRPRTRADAQPLRAPRRERDRPTVPLQHPVGSTPGTPAPCAPDRVSLRWVVRYELTTDWRGRAMANEWRAVGEVGEVLEGTARVMVTSDVWGEYGRALFVVLEDQDRKAKLTTIGSGASLMEHARMGQFVRYRGTVKGHGAYEGLPQTRVTRVKLEPVE